MPDREMNLDFERAQRLGIGEAVFCADKSSTQIDQILDEAKKAEVAILITRLVSTKYEKLSAENRKLTDYDPISGTGFFQAQPELGLCHAVAIVTAGTSDARIAREAARTLAFSGVEATVIFDVGVAGLWRLNERIEEIKSHPIVIAVAGMDAALVSVLGGLVPGLLIAVPTSTGYGIACEGKTALAAALVSCSPGVLVCNIDNGYGATCAALRAIQAATLLPKT